LGGGPALRGGFAGQGVVAGGVQDRDAEAAVWVDVWVEEGADEFEVWDGEGLASCIQYACFGDGTWTLT
jgi:hypothetical protein